MSEQMENGAPGIEVEELPVEEIEITEKAPDTSGIEVEELPVEEIEIKAPVEEGGVE